METYYNNISVGKERVEIEKIPCLRFFPKLENSKNAFSTIIYYHGWSSQKDNQHLVGHIFATLGYQVLIPDAINHGERNKLSDYSNMNDYFVSTLINTVNEYKILEQALVQKYNADEHKITVSGHSMGGYTAAGAFAKNKNIHSAIIFNGACDWKKELELKATEFKLNIDLSEELKKMDPAANLENMFDRNLFMLHGIKDSLVSYKIQKQFYDNLKPKYSDKTKIKFLGVERMDHYISINMLNEAIIWLTDIS